MDILLALIFVAALAVGLFQGMIRLIILIVALYLATVLASLYYAPLGEIFVRRFELQRIVGQYIAFAIVHGIAFLLISLAGLYTFRYTRLPGTLEYIDRIGGIFLGIAFGAILVGIIGDLLWNLLMVRGGREIDLPIFQLLGDSVANSVIIQSFSKVILPLTYTYLDPILPNGANLLFSANGSP